MFCFLKKWIKFFLFQFKSWIPQTEKKIAKLIRISFKTATKTAASTTILLPA